MPFLARRMRLERAARAVIVVATLLGLSGLWVTMSSGRSALVDLSGRTKRAALSNLGIEPDRAEIDAYWHERRERREAQTRKRYRKLFDALPPERKTLLEIGGMAPDEAVIRWGNYDMSLLLSSKVFERDGAGRYYKLRPNLRSVWFRQLHVFELDTCQFLFPETPDVLRAAEAAGAVPVRGSEQTTNSWGCRGPEPDLNAPVRGLVLGDSFMQGYFVADDQSPPACLERHLESTLSTGVSILNTGHLGYSPEHYYNTLAAFGDRFRPRFAVVAMYANDFGFEPDVLQGKGDWTEASYWLERIRQYCMERGILCLYASVPYEAQLFGPRNSGHYPGQAVNALKLSSAFFCDPTEVFVNEDLRLARFAKRAGASPLYNGHLGDCHLSPAGARLWAQFVAERLVLLLKRQPAGRRAASGS